MANPSAVERRRCAEKTARGNAFFSKGAAKRAASKCRRETGKPVMAFRCGHCRRWHLGKRRERTPEGYLLPKEGG